MKRIFTIAATLLFGACLLFLGGTHAAATNVNFSNMWVGTITPGSGHVGVDITWPGTDPLTHASIMYNPCHSYQNGSTIFQDPNYGACVMSNSGRTSYYKVQHYTPSGTDFPSGIFIDNQNTNYCTTASWCPNPAAQTISHGWANIISDIAMEIYPYNSAGGYDPFTSNVGGVRVGVNSFPTYANGGRYSPQVGNITLPQTGHSGVGKLNGFVTFNGASVGSGRAAFDMFQQGSTMSTSTGYPLSGFASDVTNGDGYYTSGAAPYGSYTIYVTDTQTGHKVQLLGVGIHSGGDRLDFNLAQHCFGYSGQCIDPAQ